MMVKEVGNNTRGRQATARIHAAFVLGYLSKSKIPYSEDYDLGVIEVCGLVDLLADQMDKTATAHMRRILQQLRDLQPFLIATEGVARSMIGRSAEGLLTEFCSAVENAVPKSSHNMKWFELGRLLAQVSDRGNEEVNVRPPEFRKMIQSHLRKLPAKFRSENPWLSRFYETPCSPRDYRKLVVTGKLFARIKSAIVATPRKSRTPKAVGEGVRTIQPKWDEGKRQFLIDGVVVKQYRHTAANQTAMLQTFENNDWAERVPNPSGDSEETQQTLKELNKLAPANIRFRADGTGEGLVWEAVGPRRMVLRLG